MQLKNDALDLYAWLLIAQLPQKDGVRIWLSHMLDLDGLAIRSVLHCEIGAIARIDPQINLNFTVSESTPTPWSGPFRDHGPRPVSQAPRPRGRGRPLFVDYFHNV